MELNNYKSVTPLKKKRKKVTASAAVVLCLICLVVGVFCGKASVDNDMEDYVSKSKYNDVVAENGALKKNEETYKIKINELKQELAAANVTIEQAPAQQPENPDAISAQKDTSKDSKGKDSGGFGRILLIIVLIAVIGGCGFLIVKIYKRKNSGYDDEEYDDEEEYYDEDEEYEDDEYYDDEDDEEYDDDDEYYDEDDEEYDDDEEYEDEDDDEE